MDRIVSCKRVSPSLDFFFNDASIKNTLSSCVGTSWLPGALSDRYGFREVCFISGILSGKNESNSTDQTRLLMICLQTKVLEYFCQAG